MKKPFSYIGAVLWNLLLAMVLYTCCRLVFFGLNRTLFADVDFARLAGLCKAGWRFDLSAVLYTNLPYIVLMLIPFRFRGNRKREVLPRGGSSQC